MKMEETKKLLSNKFWFRIIVIAIALVCVAVSYCLPSSDGSIGKTIKDLLLGIAGSALVWSFIELFDYIVNTFENYKDQRDQFIGQGQNFCSGLCDLLKNKEPEKFDYQAVCSLVSNYHQTICQTPFHEPIYAISDEFIDTYNYINRLNWKLSSLNYDIATSQSIETKTFAMQEIYSTLVEVSEIQQNLNEFAQENNDIDNEYEKLSEIEVNCEPLPIPQNIVRFGSEGNLGISSRFVDFNPGIKELKTLRISKRFDEIAEHKPSIIIVYSLIRGKLKAYE